jgi:HPt (histidine-containing phosphotransfer) domain-containing protein/CheY-like chemotaxis protein
LNSLLYGLVLYSGMASITVLLLFWQLYRERKQGAKALSLWIHEIRTPLIALEYVIRDMYGRQGSNTLSLHLLQDAMKMTDKKNIPFSSQWYGAFKQREWIQIHTFFYALFESYQAVNTDKTVTLRLTLPETGPTWVYTEAMALRHCVMNLLENALKFTKAGDVHFSVDWPGDEPANSEASEQLLMIHVENMEQLEHSDLEASTSEASMYGERILSTSNGLGLQVIQQLVRELGHAFNMKLPSAASNGCRVAQLEWRVALETRDPKLAPTMLQAPEFQRAPLLFLTQDVCDCGLDLQGLFSATGFEVDLITYPGAPPDAHALLSRIKQAPSRMPFGVWYLCTFGIDEAETTNWLEGFRTLEYPVPLVIAVSEHETVNREITRFQRDYLGPCQLLRDSRDIYPALRHLQTAVKAAGRVKSEHTEALTAVSPARILLLEDHLVQQLMMAQMITRQNHYVHVAPHAGQEGALWEQSYNAIFVDASLLPESASERLLWFESAYRKTGCTQFALISATPQLPLSVDPASLYAVDIIYKPVSPVDVQRLLHNARTASPSLDEKPLQEAKPSIAHWNKSAFLNSFGNNVSLHHQLIVVFQEEFTDKNRSFCNALAEQKWETALFFLHQLNGLAAYIQAPLLRETGLRLEAYLKDVQASRLDTSLPVEGTQFVKEWDMAFTNLLNLELLPYQNSLDVPDPSVKP